MEDNLPYSSCMDTYVVKMWKHAWMWKASDSWLWLLLRKEDREDEWRQETLTVSEKSYFSFTKWQCFTMDGSWEYHAKWNKSDRKSQKPYDYTHMWDIKLKATNEQIRQTKTHRHRQQYGSYQGEGGGWEVVKGKEG